MSFCLYNKNNITRRPAWGYEFYFLVAKTLFYSLSALVRKILFCHSKIKFISLLHRVISPLYISFKPGSSASELEAVTALQDCILNINTWMTADKLIKAIWQNGINCYRNPREVGQDKPIRAQDWSRESVCSMRRSEPRDVVRQSSEHENGHQQDLSIGTLPSA